jgi:O-antigen/teichoic acid export membrane protein
VVREALPIAGSQMIWVVRMYLPILVLWYLAARESVAHFDVAHRLLMVLQAFLTVYLANLYTPLSRAVPGPRRSFLGLLLASTAFAGLAATLAGGLLAFRPGELLGAIYGAAYQNAEAAACLVMMALIIPVLSIRGHAHYALVALGRQRRELACAVAGGVLLVLLLVWWVPDGGAVAGARAMLVSEAVGLVFTWIALWHALRQPVTDAVTQPALPVR